MFNDPSGPLSAPTPTPASSPAPGPQPTMIVVKNPFDRREASIVPLAEGAPQSVAALIGEYIPAGVEVDVSINGQIVEPGAWHLRTLAPGEQLVAIPRVEGDDFNPIAAILMIAVVAFAGPAAFALYGAAGGTLSAAAFAASWGGIALTAGITLVGSMVVGALVGPAKPKLPGASAYDASPAYSWQPATTQQPGAPIARAYGTFKLRGNIIGGYIETTGDSAREQTAHLLIDLGIGPYASLSEFKINDQAIASYTGVKVTERLGLLAQPVIPAFNDTRATYAVGAKVVSGTPITRDTTGMTFGALEVVLTLPSGLWYANDSGGMDAHAVDIKVEISTDAGVSWKNAITSPSTITTSAAGYWSAGYYSVQPEIDVGYPGVWTEVEAGSSTRTDHTEGEERAPVAGYAMQVYWRWLDVPITRTATTNDYLHLSAASTQTIRKTVRIDGLTPGTACKVRVTNLTADQTSSRYGDDVYFAELNEVLLDDFTYPRTVLVAVQALATDQLSGSLRFSCIGRCAKIWSKAGAVWSYAWSNNPAWVCYDILTQPVTDDAGTAVLRYDGLDPARIDVDAFVAWAAFCAEAVADGAGGTEARCEYDGIWDTATDMWTAALEVAATARATLVRRGTQISPVWDTARSAPAQIFTVANSKDFGESFLPIEGRAAVIEVEFSNKALDYGRDTVSIVNDAVAAAGVVPPASRAFRGVVRASQCWREANLMLARNQYLHRTGELAVGIDALRATVGDRVDLQVDVTRWGAGGRAVAGTTTQVTLDHPVTLAAGTNEIQVRLSDAASDAIETRTITTGAGTVSVIDVTPAFSFAVQQYDPWAIGAVGQATKPFLITDIKRDVERQVKLALIEYNASLYGLDAGIPALPTPNVSASVGFGSAIDLVVSERQIPALDGTSRTEVSIQFGFDDRAQVRAVLAYAQPIGAGAGTKTARGTGDSVQFDDLVDGVSYLFTLVTQNRLGQWQPFSAGATATYQVVGRGATVQGPGAAGVPPAPTALTASAGLFSVALAWTADVGTRRDIRHTEIWASNTNDRAAAARLTCAPWPETAYTHIGLAPAQQWFYWVRLTDTSGNVSAWYPAGATAGVSGVPSSDPSDLLTQLQDAVGMAQLAQELAQPIGVDFPNMAIDVQGVSEAALRLLLKADEAKLQAITEKWVTDATVEIDRDAGTVTLLATAEISTDVEARLNQVELSLGAQDGSIIAHTASLTDHSGRISVAETDIISLEGSISLKASTSYVDTAVAGALGALDPEAQELFTNANAIGLLHSLLDSDAGRILAQSSVARLASAERTLDTHADAISAEATERLIVAAKVDSNLAAIVSEASARASADDAEASARIALAVTVSSNTAAISSEQTARADGDSANASSINTLSAQVNHATTGLPAAHSAIVTEQTARANGDSANASYITTIEARLDTGDFAAVKVESSANANAIGDIEAKWGVQVQSMSDGTRALAGITLLAGGDGESVFAVLADKLLVYKPDGSGTPKQIVTLGTVNGVTALGLLGDLIVDGTIVTRTIAANNVTQPVSASSVGSIELTLAGTEYDVQSVTITTSGSPVFVIGTSSINIDTGTFGYQKLYRGATQIHQSGMAGNSSVSVGVANMIVDTPAAGTYTYTLKAQRSGGVNKFCSQRTLLAMEIKR